MRARGAVAPLASTQSVLREIIAEHLLVGELLRWFWRQGVADVEVLRSEFDAGGYDLVVSRGDVVRHIQLKTLSLGGKAAAWSVSLKLAARPAGCVVVLVLDESLQREHMLWFGDPDGGRLPAIDSYPVTKHTKGDADGVKAERSGHRSVPRRAFARVDDLEQLAALLLGHEIKPVAADL